MLKIRRLRQERNITQIQLAKYLNVSNTTISNWENNLRVPDIFILIKIADYFKVSLDTLVGREFKENPSQNKYY